MDTSIVSTVFIVSTVSDYTSNYINVYVCKTHYGHECILGYTRLQSTLRQSIAGKLTQGVEVDRIIIGYIGHDDDATSVRLWVDEMESKGDKTPVLVARVAQ